MSDSPNTNMEEKSTVATNLPSRIPPWRMVLDQERITSSVLNHPYDGKGTAEDPYIVTWIDNDHGNPMTFSKSFRWTICMLHAAATFVVALDSSAFSGPYLLTNLG